MRNTLAAIPVALAVVLMTVLPCEAKRDTLVVALTNIKALDITSTNTRQSLNLVHPEFAYFCKLHMIS
jgi:hypothetical protein